MVTIDPDKSIQPITTKKSDGASKPDVNGFEAVFKQVVDTKTPDPANVESIPFLADVHPVRFAASRPNTANMVVEQVQNLVDTMADYQKKLAENGATLKDMQVIVDRMASQSEALGLASTAVGKDDPLKAIVNQATMLSSMEIARFYNGQYNDE